MLKLSRTGLTTLKRRYKSVLLKCLAINAAALMAAGVASAADVTVAGGTIWGGASSGDATTTEANYTTKAEGDALAGAINANTANITTNANNITALETAVAGKASQSDLTAATGRIDDLENAGYQTASQVGTAIDAKLGSYTTTTELETTYATKTELTNGLAEKASQSDLTAATGRITALETTVGDASSGLVKDVADNTTAINENKANIETNKNNIETNKTNITANTNAIDKLNGDVDTAGSVLNSIRENAENADFTPAGNISSTTIGGALKELDTEKANLAGGNTFTGDQTFQDNISVGGNTTVGGTLGVTGNTTVGGKLGVTGAATLDDTLTVDGETTLNGATTVNDALTVTGDTSLKNTNVDGKLEVTGNTTVGGTLDVTGAATLNDKLTVDGLTKLSNTNGMTFDGSTIVKSIDDGATAVTGAGDATKLATTSTVMKSAENAEYNGTTKLADGSAPTTIKDALDVIGDVEKLTTSTNFTNGGAIDVETISDALQGIDKTLGKIHGLANADGTVNNSASTFRNGGTNLARGTTVEDHLVSLDNAIGNRTAMTNTMAVDYTAGGIAGKDLSTALSQVASNIGTATTTTFNGVAADATVNANIDAINTALGDVVPTMATTHYAAGATNLSDAVKSIDEKLYSLDNDVKSLKKDFQAGMAEMAALSALVPNARATGDTQISFGTGAYEGHTAAALGGFHWINDNVMLNIGASWGNSSNAAYRAGITYSW